MDFKGGWVCVGGCRDLIIGGFLGSYQLRQLPSRESAQGDWVSVCVSECRDLIIVDTSGRHKQEESLFEEMRQVAAGALGVCPATLSPFPCKPSFLQSRQASQGRGG